MINNSLITGDFGIKDHIVICNWTKKADTIVRELHNQSVHEKRPIIVVTEYPENVPKTNELEYRGLMIIGGDPSDKSILQRADIKNAFAVIVLADDRIEEHADSKAVLIALAIDSINPNVHVIVEINNSKNKMHFQYTHVNEIICIDQLAEKLLSQTALTPGLSQVYMDLLTQSSDTNEIYIEEVPPTFIKKTYEELEKSIIEIDEEDIILIGFSTIVEKKIKNFLGNEIKERIFQKIMFLNLMIQFFLLLMKNQI